MSKLTQEEIIKAVEEMTVLELNELVKAVEEKFGVSTTVAMAAAPVSGGTDAAPAADTTEEKTAFDVELTETGGNKIAVIKAVREINNTLGLAEAKTLVESAPKMILEGAKKETAAEVKKKLEAAGAKVTLR